MHLRLPTAVDVWNYVTFSVSHSLSRSPNDRYTHSTLWIGVHFFIHCRSDPAPIIILKVTKQFPMNMFNPKQLPVAVECQQDCGFTCELDESTKNFIKDSIKEAIRGKPDYN